MKPPCAPTGTPYRRSWGILRDQTGTLAPMLLLGTDPEFAAQAEVCSYCSLVFVRDQPRGARRLGLLKGRFEPFGAYRD